jgi:hypothetical protein
MDTPNYGHWIRQAEMCRRTAASATSDTLRKRFLDFAAHYDTLAAASVPDATLRQASVCDGTPVFFAAPILDPVSDMLITARAA